MGGEKKIDTQKVTHTHPHPHKRSRRASKSFNSQMTSNGRLGTRGFGASSSPTNTNGKRARHTTKQRKLSWFHTCLPSSSFAACARVCVEGFFSFGNVLLQPSVSPIFWHQASTRNCPTWNFLHPSRGTPHPHHPSTQSASKCRVATLSRFNCEWGHNANLSIRAPPHAQTPVKHCGGHVVGEDPRGGTHAIPVCMQWGKSTRS